MHAPVHRPRRAMLPPSSPDGPVPAFVAAARTGGLAPRALTSPCAAVLLGRRSTEDWANEIGGTSGAVRSTSPGGGHLPPRPVNQVMVPNAGSHRTRRARRGCSPAASAHDPHVPGARLTAASRAPVLPPLTFAGSGREPPDPRPPPAPTGANAGTPGSLSPSSPCAPPLATPETRLSSGLAQTAVAVGACAHPTAHCLLTYQ